MDEFEYKFKNQKELLLPQTERYLKMMEENRRARE
jgi:hypothetical protein